MTPKDSMLKAIITPAVVERVEKITWDDALKRAVRPSDKLSFYVAAVQSHYDVNGRDTDMRNIHRAIASGMPTVSDIIDHLYTAGLCRYRVSYAKRAPGVQL
jgi:hypothetical protein